MKLANAERAIVDIAKLREYCLSMAHEEGKHKARVFAAALGLHASDAEELRLALLRVVAASDAAVRAKLDAYGQRYTLDFDFSFCNRIARLRSCWIVHPDEDFPRLTSCYVL